MNIICKLNE